MPVYHARSIAVQLASMPLGETTTSDVVLKKGDVAKRQSEAAEKKLLNSVYLNERRVLFPGDRDGFELNWLGDTPFMQTQVDACFLQSPGSYASDHGQAYGTPKHNRHHALALHVKLSDKAFLSGFSGRIHLKIEVLFNGQLSTCSLIHTNDIRSGAKSLHQIFAGSRVDFLAERPWVLLPPHTNANGGTRRFRKTIPPTERWREVSAAIQTEAEERGTDKYGGLPPSAAFLHALASMEMPECVSAMQKPGGRKFGVIDVIITAGYGNKITTGTSYLKRPQRLKDLNYAVRAEIRSEDEAAAAEPAASHDAMYKIVNETEANLTNNEAGGEESDGPDEHTRKRRAFSSVKGLPQQSLKSDSQSPFLSEQMFLLLPPIRQTYPSNLSPTAGTPLCLDRVDAPNVSTQIGPSTPFMAPSALLLPTPPEWSAPSSATTPPCHYPMSFQQMPHFHSSSYPPVVSAYMPTNGLPDLLPQTPPLHPHSGPVRFKRPVMSSLPLVQPPGQLPPTAMFSVPSKPQRSSSPDKGATTNMLDVSSNHVTISRLVITGRDGKPIVDHTWSMPQRIRPVIGNYTFGEGQTKQSTLQQRTSLADNRADERNNPLNDSSASSRATAPIKRPQNESNEKHTGEQRRDSVVDPALDVQLPYLKRHQGPIYDIPPVNPMIDVPDKIAPFVPAHLLAVATPTLVPSPVQPPGSASPSQPSVSQRRTFSRNPLPSIQGPKAANYLFDDPEEVLREAAGMRRSRSPTKPAITPIVLRITPIVDEILTPDQNAQGSSSPLSSVPSSPLSEKPAEVMDTADAAPVRIPQLDGSPERALPATSPRKLLTQELHYPGPMTPQTSMSPNAKKRKASQLSPIRPPRSPDRLKTADNPPLNEDCVIALAESADKQEERGVLRQIKGERQGIFKEEYVVLAVRFFVAGD
ncbi:hypothetical protein N0V91_003683 [Didymella pomorum]|uniref:Uncharacterized protein n=1 Tax=Didymella pomorum TaxID=749634 RepID=A0A9W9D8U8_9PLEO|nr:hypothetical protein N0V91_003683 [Didymella pomorum]